MPIDTVASVCGMCPVQCPIEVEVENGVCRFIHGNRRIPGIRGALCTKGAAGISFWNDSDRPAFPMLRSGVRGQGGWKRIDWDEAFDIAADRLRSYTSTSGSSEMMWLDSGGCFSGFRRAFAQTLTPHVHTEDAIVGAPVNEAARSLFGFDASRLVPDFRNARHVVLQGRNLLETVHIQQANDLLDNLETGGALTVVDIRSNPTTSKASRRLAVRPGTDYALNLAVIHLLLKDHRSMLALDAIGDIDQLENAVQDCTASWAQELTGIPAADIVSLVRDLAKAAPKIVWMTGRGVWGYADSFYICRSAWIINALLGAIGTVGGMLIAFPEEAYGERSLNGFTADSTSAEPVPSSDKPKPWELLTSLADPSGASIRTLVCYRSDPLAIFPDPSHTRELLHRLETIVCITDFWTETAWMADLVLPLSTYLERESIIGRLDLPHPLWVVRKRCMAPSNDTKADWEIVAGLARRLGRSDFAVDGIDAIWSRQLEGTGIRMRDFDRTGFIDIAGPSSGSIPQTSRLRTVDCRVSVFDPALKSRGIAPLAAFATKPEPEAGRFRLIVGGCGIHHEGNTINVPLLNRQMPENVLWMNRSAAESLGISNGDRVRIGTETTEAVIAVRLSEFMAPGAVFLVRGFGRGIPAESRAFGKGVSAVGLMTDGWKTKASISGAPCWAESFVTVSLSGKAESEGSRS
ncbi:MAG: molybdopterin-dependent oxidoreductase [Thermodesulfobacteriota bacterium]